MYYTHIAFALLSSLIAIKFLNISNPYIFILIVCFVSLIPDIDNKDSKLGRKFKFVSMFFEHRGILHTIFPPLLLFILLSYFNYNLFAWAVLIGYLSHILIDGLTLEGINFLHPISSFRISGFVRTGAFFEIIFFLLFVGLDVFYLVKMVF
ncbi:MAG: metal-dependent hydrolase [Nanoarchaeota archaeon]|nr:metal-dependent hydrolase [Nanoarchaeota archaeon]MBU0962623.1 metal-dependent hydrolase [Nanoarchaeota archaeon]